MSETMSAVEIEDVLSSIRRLVSEDLRPTHKLVSAALQVGAAKLILTPALRVVSNDQTGFGRTADDLDDPGDLQSVLQKIAVQDAPETVEIFPMFGSVRLQEMADVRADDLPGQVPGAASDVNFLATAMSRINGLSTSEVPLAAPPETIEAVVAAVGAAVGADEWEVDGGDPAPQAKAWADTVWNSADVSDPQAERGMTAEPLVLSDPVGLVADTEVPFAHVDPDEVADPAAQDMADPAAQDMATPSLVAEAGAGAGDDLVRPDDFVFHVEVSPPPRIEAGGRVSAETPQQRAGFAQDDLADGDDGAGFLNEDLLRDIVRDMIQAELQGTLGERITRNVRKLVRAEINRALASRDYE